MEELVIGMADMVGEVCIIVVIVVGISNGLDAVIVVASAADGTKTVVVVVAAAAAMVAAAMTLADAVFQVVKRSFFFLSVILTRL